jgi:predicted  nucleic acid-binding Zn-ribbon protein
MTFTHYTDEELLRFCEAENGHLEAEGELVKRAGALIDTAAELEEQLQYEAETTVPVKERDELSNQLADAEERIAELEEEVETLEARIIDLTPVEIGA